MVGSVRGHRRLGVGRSRAGRGGRGSCGERAGARSGPNLNFKLGNDPNVNHLSKHLFLSKLPYIIITIININTYLSFPSNFDIIHLILIFHN